MSSTMPIIAPSILAANFAKLGKEIEDVTKAGAHMIHLDIMDNHYVPNLSFGPMICESIIKNGVSIPLDVHLMCSPVDSLITTFLKMNVDYITFHPEASLHIDRSIQLIKNENCKVGIALNPATPISYLDHIIEKVDMVLIMSVNPGFGGQTFIKQMIPKINDVKQLINKQNHPIRLQVDGGVTCDNIKSIQKAGADTFVMGSAIFNTPNYNQTFEAIRKELA